MRNPKWSFEESANDNDNKKRQQQSRHVGAPSNVDPICRYDTHALLSPNNADGIRTGSYSSRCFAESIAAHSSQGCVQTECDGLCLMASMGVAACLSCTWFCCSADAKLSLAHHSNINAVRFAYCPFLCNEIETRSRCRLPEPSRRKAQPTTRGLPIAVIP